MENSLFTTEINLLDKQIQLYTEEKNKYITKKQSEINELLKQINSNTLQISSLKKKLDSDKITLSSINETKETKLKILITEIENLQNQINILQNQNISTYDKDTELLKNEISNIKTEKQKLVKRIKYIKKKIYILSQRQNEENEKNNMLQEEYFSCKKLLIMLTSKIESHSEFIKTLCKSKNALTSSLEKLNEIDPDNSEFTNNVIEMNKLAEMIYSYCHEYFEFKDKYEVFIDKIKNQDDIDKVIDYLQEISKYSITKNLFEYILIALCRIMTYEKILDLRMKFMNNIEKKEEKNYKKDNNKENEICNGNKMDEICMNNNNDIINVINIKNSNQLNNLILYKKEYGAFKLKLEKCEKSLLNKENIYNQINKDKKENNDNITNMINDLSQLTKYKEKLSEKIEKKEKHIIKREKDFNQIIDNLTNEINSCKEKIVKKNLKLKENSKNMEDKLNELIKIKNSMINTNNERKTKTINDNLIKKNFSRNINLDLKTNHTNTKKEEKEIIENTNLLNKLENEEKNSIVSITQLIQSNNNSLKSSKDSNKENVLYNKTESNKDKINEALFKLTKSLSEEDFIIIQNIKPLFQEVSVLKREIIHIKQKIYENYHPVINNTPTLPTDYHFKKYILYLDKNLEKIHFQKSTSSDRSLNISPTSILRLEIPAFTKNLIFLQKIYSNLNKKLKLDSTKKINEYFIKEKDNIVKLYFENFGKNKKIKEKDINKDEIAEIIDEKIFDEKYREALLINKQYMINIYLKPDEDTKIEILFQTRNDFKNWINGLDELVSNYQKIKELTNS